MPSAKIDQVKLMQELTLEVTFVRTREMRIRLWIAVRLIHLACFITGMGLEIKHEEVDNDPFE